LILLALLSGNNSDELGNLVLHESMHERVLFLEPCRFSRIIS
jgi:hypothetical protein